MERLVRLGDQKKDHFECFWRSLVRSLLYRRILKGFPHDLKRFVAICHIKKMAAQAHMASNGSFLGGSGHRNPVASQAPHSIQCQQRHKIDR
ncbi:hypothetical protein ASY01nite_16620 [Acetobacter syzygii]|nr:hypothetical protein AA0483_0420 [Acetobacter syzygii NRIC 0483]GEL56596.1 hypothetical protein ASY01nite_16620 [Acetobacter syzygii]